MGHSLAGIACVQTLQKLAWQHCDVTQSLGKDRQIPQVSWSSRVFCSWSFPPPVAAPPEASMVLCRFFQKEPWDHTCCRVVVGHDESPVRRRRKLGRYILLLCGGDLLTILE